MYYVLDSSEKLNTCYFSEGYSIAVHQVISDEECCALVRGPSIELLVCLAGECIHIHIYIYG